MIVGIGTDIFLMSRIPYEVINNDDPFIKRAYRENERLEANKRNDKHVFFASRFCAKEAIYKALSIIEIEFKPGEIEVLTDNNGKPYVNLYGLTKEKLNVYTDNNYKIHVSISYENDYASSFAIVETK